MRAAVYGTSSDLSTLSTCPMTSSEEQRGEQRSKSQAATHGHAPPAHENPFDCGAAEARLGPSMHPLGAASARCSVGSPCRGGAHRTSALRSPHTPAPGTSSGGTLRPSQPSLVFTVSSSRFSPSPQPQPPPATMAPVTESLMPHPNSAEGGETDRHRKLQLHPRKVSSDFARRNDCPLQPKEDQSSELFFETLLVYSSPNPRIQAA